MVDTGYRKIFIHKISHKIAQHIKQHFPQDKNIPQTKNFLDKNFPKEFPTTLFPIEFHARFSCKNFPQELLTNIKEFTVRFSRCDFPQDVPARISHKFSRKNYPTRLSCKDFPQIFPQNSR